MAAGAALSACLSALVNLRERRNKHAQRKSQRISEFPRFGFGFARPVVTTGEQVAY